MNSRDKQYHIFFTNMGYEFVYHPDKSGFMIKGVGYAKVCDYPASQFIKDQAKEAAKKQRIILMPGNLGFKLLDVYQYHGDGELWNYNGLLCPQDDKYFPVFFNEEYLFDCWSIMDKAITLGIRNGEDVVCKRCGSINEFRIEKPSIHYKCTCTTCNNFITNIGTNEPAILYFGKYQGREVSSLKSNEELQYLQWLIANSKTIKGKLKSEIEKHLSI